MSEKKQNNNTDDVTQYIDINDIQDVVSEDENKEKKDNWFKRLFDKLFKKNKD